MNAYTIASKKSPLFTHRSFIEKNYRRIHPKGKQKIVTIGFRKCLLFEGMKFSLAGRGLSVIMSMSVWSEKKKEETNNIHIFTYTHSNSVSLSQQLHKRSPTKTIRIQLLPRKKPQSIQKNACKKPTEDVTNVENLPLNLEAK